MHRDPTLRKRNALVIPGVLLLLLGLVGILYVQLVRPDTVACEDGQLIVLAGACRSATLVLLVPLALGVLLTGLGAAIRRKVTCSLGHGTAATATLVVLFAVALLPLLAAAGLYLTQDPDAPYTMTFGDVDYSQAKLLAGLGGLLLVALVPYFVLYLGTGKPPKCCRDKGCFDPCYCDEEAAPPVPTFAQAEEVAVAEEVIEEAPVEEVVYEDVPAPVEEAPADDGAQHAAWPLHADGPAETPSDSNMTTGAPFTLGGKPKAEPKPKKASAAKGKKTRKVTRKKKSE